MSARKQVLEQYFEGWRRGDHDAILACLTDDIVWYIAGFTTLSGKDAYDREIDNPEFTGTPVLNVDRVIEDGDTIVAVGDGEATFSNGSIHRFAFSDIFDFTGDLISRRESYVVPLTEGEQPATTG